VAVARGVLLFFQRLSAVRRGRRFFLRLRRRGFNAGVTGWQAPYCASPSGCRSTASGESLREPLLTLLAGVAILFMIVDPA